MITKGRSVWSYWKWILGLKGVKAIWQQYIAPVFTVTNKKYSIKGI